MPTGNRRHGESNPETPEYMLWKAMHQRCRNPNHKDYKSYGGRGITVAPEWRNYPNFLADMGRRPSPELTLERIRNNEPYSKSNCCWASRIDQGANTRRSTILTYGHISLTANQWAKRRGIKPATIYFRIRQGWPLAEVLEYKQHVARRPALDPNRFPEKHCESCGSRLSPNQQEVPGAFKKRRYCNTECAYDGIYGKDRAERRRK